MSTPIALVITVERSYVSDWGNDVYLNGQLIGHRPYDGSRPEEITTEVTTALASLLSKELDWDPLGLKDDDS